MEQDCKFSSLSLATTKVLITSQLRPMIKSIRGIAKRHPRNMPSHISSVVSLERCYETQSLKRLPGLKDQRRPPPVVYAPSRAAISDQHRIWCICGGSQMSPISIVIGHIRGHLRLSAVPLPFFCTGVLSDRQGLVRLAIIKLQCHLLNSCRHRLNRQWLACATIGILLPGSCFLESPQSQYKDDHQHAIKTGKRICCISIRSPPTGPAVHIPSSAIREKFHRYPSEQCASRIIIRMNTVSENRS